MADLFRILEHTADIGLEAFGATREEVFANSARALFHILVDAAVVEPRQPIVIHVQGANASELLVNWLSELLYFQDADGWLFRDFEVISLSDTAMRAVAHGEQFDPARHQIKLAVKAITYHQLLLEETPGGWRAQVYVDI
jgi:SHS2 domain-containing protein